MSKPSSQDEPSAGSVSPVADPREDGTDVDRETVSAYLRSETFEHRSKIASQKPIRDEQIDDLIQFGRDSEGASSFILGLLGLNGILILAGVAMPIGMELVEELFRTQPTYVVQVMVMQTLLFPPVICFSFVTVTPMFWYGSVVLRFVAGIVSVVPGCVAFLIAIEAVENSPDEFPLQFAAVMFSLFLAAGTVAVAVQLWTPWTLTHAVADDFRLPPTGTRAMMELTLVAAAGFAFFMAIDLVEIAIGLLFFSLAGLICAVAVITVQVAFMRRERIDRLAAAISVGCAFTASFCFGSFVAWAGFGWQSITSNLLLISLTSLYGTAVICGLNWVCLSWLKRCGWSCVRRDQGRKRLA